MAIVTSARYLVIVIICLLNIGNSQHEIKMPKLKVQVLSPSGFRITVQGENEMGFYCIRVKLRNITDYFDILGEVTGPADREWIYEEPGLVLKVNDRLRIYVSFVDNEKRSKILKSINYTVRALIAREDKGECRPTATRLRVGTACAGQTIFEDKFNSLNEDLWQIEQYIPSDPEYPFMSYQRPPYAHTVTVVNGCLRIEPKLQQEQDGFSNETLYSGSLDLFNGCTRTAESCSMTAMGANILPPVVSGRITSKSFAFTYGVVEIRARLPQGDWLYPEILLEPLLKKYGSSKYASGVIKIAAALGNVDLELIPNVYGNKILYGGPLMSLVCKDVLTGRKELFNESQWGDYFHVYSLRWTPDDMTFRVDGEEWLRVEPTASGLSGRFNHFCDIPRTFLSFGNKMAPFDDHFQLALGVAVGGVTEFKDGVTTDFGHPKPWSNRNRKASYNFWRDLPAWRPTWTQPDLQVDYIKVTAL